MSTARSASACETRHVVLMGVCGSGKSSVGAELSARTGLPYRDGDDLHPGGNVEKMRRGEPLTDADRWPWLDLCGAALRDAPAGLILGCSALRRVYRDRLRAASGQDRLLFVHLTGPESLLRSRMAGRTAHYMPIALLESQLATLEPPGADERAITVGIDRPLDAVVGDILPAIGSQTPSGAADPARA